MTTRNGDAASDEKREGKRGRRGNGDAARRKRKETGTRLVFMVQPDGGGRPTGPIRRPASPRGRAARGRGTGGSMNRDDSPQRAQRAQSGRIGGRCGGRLGWSPSDRGTEPPPTAGRIGAGRNGVRPKA